MPKEYIIREDVINDIGELFTICRETLPNECGHHFIVESELQSHLDFVRNLPAADVAEVRHGRWKFHEDGSGTCQECGCRQKYVWDVNGWQNYCGHCGADMRNGGQNDG